VIFGVRCCSGTPDKGNDLIMLHNFDVIAKSILALLLLFIGLTAVIGGLRKKPHPFFWLKGEQVGFLKTPMHYVLFGAVCLLAVIWWVWKLVVLYKVF
jgi:hypothetical protein